MGGEGRIMGRASIKDYAKMLTSKTPEQLATVGLGVNTTNEVDKVLTPDFPKIYNDWRENYKKLSDYTISKNGELCRIKMKYNTGTQDYEPEYIPLANFTARIAKEVVKDDGLESKALFEIEGFLLNDKPLPLITVESNKFTAMNWVIDGWGGDAIFSPGVSCKDYLRHAIQTVSLSNKTRQTVFCHTGWRKIENKWVYLHAGGGIGANNVIVDITGEGCLSKYILPAVTNNVRAAEMALKLLDVADYKITVPLLSLVYLTPLCEPLRKAGKEPAFIVWLNGMTQSMKSSLAAVCLSHFGEFTALNLPASFKDTANSLERKGFLLKDSLLVIDDFHPSATKAESQHMHKTAQMALRAWGDRQGRSRANVDGTLRPSYPPRSMCLITGEDLPDVGQSGAARYFAISLKRGDIDKTKLSELQSNTDMLAQNMTGYLEWVSMQIEDIIQNAKGEINSFRDIFNKQGYSGRMPDTVAWLYYGWCIALKYFNSIGVLPEDKQGELLKIGLNTLLELAEEHARTIQEEQPAKKFISALREMIAAEIVDIVPVQDVPRQTTNFIGWRDLDFYYLLPDATFAALVQFYNKQNSNFPVTKQTLWKHLANDGYIETDGKQTSKQKKINNKNQRFVWLKIDSLEERG